LDLRAFLPDLKSSDSSSTPHPFERERLLTDRLYDEAKLLFTPGEACHAAEPGFFRCCFAWAPAEGIAEGFRRLAKWAATQRASKQSTQ
jgi:1-aminocyclopropane-1-carboxylate synthase